MLSKSLVEVWKLRFPCQTHWVCVLVRFWVILMQIKFWESCVMAMGKHFSDLGGQGGQLTEGPTMLWDLLLCLHCETVLPVGCLQPGTQCTQTNPFLRDKTLPSNGRLGLLGSQMSCWTFLRFTASKSLPTMTAAMKLGDTCCLEEKQWQT